MKWFTKNESNPLESNSDCDLSLTQNTYNRTSDFLKPHNNLTKSGSQFNQV